MTNQFPPGPLRPGGAPPGPPAEPPIVVASEEDDRPSDAQPPAEMIESPAKVLRIGAMTKELLEEVRRAPLDEAGRERLREIYETSVRELSACLADDLGEELARLSSPFETAAPSEAELRVAQAQLVGWLEGLFHGIQATLFSQQMAARAQLEEMRSRGLPPGRMPEAPRPGTYL
ncbi:MAG TPA: bacterial proteasome activator family protein [Acidimicrobiales bacterium]|nr:bacterial proteasome activator family protein [Acidimicrobiales bacterium]